MGVRFQNFIIIFYENLILIYTFFLGSFNWINMEFSEFLQIFGGFPLVLERAVWHAPAVMSLRDPWWGIVVDVIIVSFFGVKIAKKQGGGKSHSFGFSLHRFFEMVRKMEGTRDGSRSWKNISSGLSAWIALTCAPFGQTTRDVLSVRKPSHTSLPFSSLYERR